jgi:hypothetical protein
MPAITKQKTKLHLKLTHSDHATAHGGQVLIDALCRRFDLWKRLQQEPSLDPRQRQNIGFTPAAVIAQLIFTLTSGGASLADAERIGQPGEKTTPQGVFERHRLKGAKEQGFSEVLSGLDLHHPPCSDLVANRAFYAIVLLACNLLTSLKVPDLPDDAQGWRIQTTIRHLLTLPVTVSTHARYDVARVCIPAGWLRWWRLFVDQWAPKRKSGRPVVEAVDSAQARRSNPLRTTRPQGREGGGVPASVTQAANSRPFSQKTPKTPAANPPCVCVVPSLSTFG